MTQVDASVIEIKTDPFPPQRELSDLWRAAWEVDGLDDFQSVLTRSITHVGAFDQALLIGFANMAWDGGNHAFLIDVCVHPNYRDHGVGHKLVERAVATAKKRGVQWIHVDFEPHLKDFYLKCGFKTTEAGVLRVRD